MTFPQYHRRRDNSCPTPLQRLRFCLEQSGMDAVRIVSLPHYPSDAPGLRFRVDIPPHIWKPRLMEMDDNEFLCDYLGNVMSYGWLLSSYISDDFQPEGDWYSFSVIWLGV